jgi:AcrR family transcriptional regulator
MARTWSSDDPKAGLMARKRAQIVAAAHRAFVDEGYAGSSVNRIADDAGVSIKTLYRHFDSKDDLFSAVMQAACEVPLEGDGTKSADWASRPPEQGLAMAGEQYLHHVLSPEQLGLYRVVMHDAQRFPELGARYDEEVVGKRRTLFADYLDRWAPRQGWKIRDRQAAAAIFASLLNADVLESALQGRWMPGEGEIAERATIAAQRLLCLIEAGLL